MVFLVAFIINLNVQQKKIFKEYTACQFQIFNISFWFLTFTFICKVASHKTIFFNSPKYDQMTHKIN